MKKMLNAANVLRLIRDKKANDLKSLCPEFGVAADSYESVYVRRVLEDLKEAELIVTRGDERFEITPKWERIHNAFRVGLTELGQLDESSLVVKPHFGKPEELADAPDLFVLMPFAATLKPVYEDHIEKVAGKLRLRARCAKDFFTSHHIMTDIWAAIWSARVIVADCTGRNPNVFYEIGIAHAVGKPVILITQSSEDIPFDLRSLRYITYEYSPRGMAEFERVLGDTVRETLDLPK